jgi:hypothetical protein
MAKTRILAQMAEAAVTRQDFITDPNHLKSFSSSNRAPVLQISPKVVSCVFAQNLLRKLQMAPPLGMGIAIDTPHSAIRTSICYAIRTSI